jgi:hypothetical protein
MLEYSSCASQPEIIFPERDLLQQHIRQECWQRLQSVFVRDDLVCEPPAAVARTCHDLLPAQESSQLQFSADFRELTVEVREFAHQHDLIFIEPKISELEALRLFLKNNWHAKRRRKIEDLRTTLSAEIANMKLTPHLDVNQQRIAYLRYLLEADHDTYRSGRFTPAFVAEMLGFAEVEQLFFQEDGLRRTIVDLGCGDGDMLMELAKGLRRMVRGKEFLDIYVSLLIKHGSEVKFESAEIFRNIQKKLTSTLEGENIILHLDPEPPDPHLIGIDLAEPFLKRLQSPRYGISGRKGDIRAPFRDFAKKTGLKKGSAGVVMSTLTLDRVEPEALFKNLSYLLAEQGVFMLATKSIIDPRSDGLGKKGQPISYYEQMAQKDLKSNSALRTLEKLTNALKTYGLKVERVSCHPYAVISTDCRTSGAHMGPQRYNLIVVSGCLGDGSQ